MGMEWSGNGLGTMQLNGSALEMRLYTVDRTIYNITVFRFTIFFASVYRPIPSNHVCLTSDLTF